MNEFKDYVGNIVKVGDVVIFYQQGYRNFEDGIVERISAKQLVIRRPNRTWRSTFKQFHEQVIKHPTKTFL